MTTRTAMLASIPEREALLKQTLASLRPQVDEICVYLNGYGSVPRFLEGCTVARSQDYGDRGDAGKFFWSAERKGWIFTCDDDLIYPGNYTDKMARRVEFLDRVAAVTAHGGIVPKEPTRFLRGRRMFPLSKVLKEPIFVNTAGTGVLCYHTDTICVRPEDFEKPNMADLWFAGLAQRQRVPIQTVEHPAWWAKSQIGDHDTLYKRTVREGDAVQTEVLHRFSPWRVWTAEAWQWRITK